PWRGDRDAGVVLSAPFTHVRIDAELRAHLEGKGGDPVPPVVGNGKPPRKRTTFQASHTTIDPPQPILALGAGDVDGDGSVELVALTADLVIVYGIKRDS